MQQQKYEVGDLVRVWVAGKYVERVGSTAVLEGSGGVSRIHVDMIQGAATALEWQKDCEVAVSGYVSTVGRRGGLMVKTMVGGGHSASISGKQIRKVEVRS